MAFTLRATPSIPAPRPSWDDLEDWSDTYGRLTRVGELHGCDHVTADGPITLDEFRRLRAEGRA